MRTRHAFTLVELLVVIGIIALMIAILLPVLGSARRQAARVKCATQLKEFGNAMIMYAHDNNGYLPPPRYEGLYELDGLRFHHAGSEVPGQVIREHAKWWHFLRKYLTKNKAMPQLEDGMAAYMTGIYWCPSFPGYSDGSGRAENYIDGVNRNFIGYAMNWWPLLNADTDAATFNANGFPSGTAGQATRFNPPTHSWYKLVQYKKPAEKALVADARDFYLEARRVPVGGTIPGQRLNAANNDYSPNPVGQSQTMYDFYRHGLYPPIEDPRLLQGWFSSNGGKVGYNILYADGHVDSPPDREEAYRAARGRHPG